MVPLPSSVHACLQISRLLYGAAYEHMEELASIQVQNKVWGAGGLARSTQVHVLGGEASVDA